QPSGGGVGGHGPGGSGKLRRLHPGRRVSGSLRLHPSGLYTDLAQSVVEASAAVSVMMAARARSETVWMVAILVLGLLAPWVLTDYLADLALLWLMVLFALTWDINGGQMGYNSFGNVFFFGLGVYACAVFQREADLGYVTEL